MKLTSAKSVNSFQINKRKHVHNDQSLGECKLKPKMRYTLQLSFQQPKIKESDLSKYQLECGATVTLIHHWLPYQLNNHFEQQFGNL